MKGLAHCTGVVCHRFSYKVCVSITLEYIRDGYLLLGVINSLLFFGESSTMRILEPDLKQGQMGSVFNTVIAGCCGGVLQCILLVPSDVIKCTMQADAPPAGVANPSNAHKSNAFLQTWNCMQGIYRAEGFRGFYKGFGATILRECPSIGGYFFSYKYLKEVIRTLEGTEAPSSWSILISGGFAGAISWTCVYPMDVIKTNLQIAPLDTKAVNSKGKLTNLSMAKYLYKTHGYRVFTRGLGTTVLRAFPVNASTFYFYEKLKEIYHFTD
jgi:solute carrier family 25 carnitine/acylcarnitine transporter 20/29